MTQNNVFPLSIADANRSIRHVFIRDLVLDAKIGVYPTEKGRTQKVRINVDLAVPEPPHPLPDELDAVVCYDALTTKITNIVTTDHINLVETLAERIADTCLADVRILSVRVRIEKLEAIPSALSVGVEIERKRPGAE